MEQLSTSPNPEDCSLVEIVTLLQEDVSGELVRDLKTEVYKRLYKKFYSRLNKIAQKYKGISGVDTEMEDIFQGAFLIFFDKLEQFDVSTSWDDRECEKVLLFWLSKAANIMFLDRTKKQKNSKKAIEEYKEYLEVEGLEGGTGRRLGGDTFDGAMFNQVWNKLSPMAKEIILACAKHDTLNEENTKHLPDEVLDSIAERYNVTKPAIRKSKERTLKKLIRCKL